MIKYDKVCNNVFKDNIRHVKNYYKTMLTNNSHFFFNFVFNEWRELDSLISFSKEL